MRRIMTRALTQKEFANRIKQLKRSGLSIAVDIDARVLSGPHGERTWITWWGLTAGEAVKLIWGDPRFVKDFLEEVRECASDALTT